MIGCNTHDDTISSRAGLGVLRSGWQSRTLPATLALALCVIAICPTGLHAGMGGILSCFRDAGDHSTVPETELAEELLGTIPSGISISLRPISIEAADVPDGISDIHDSLLNALIRTGGDQVIVQTRHYRKVVYDSLNVFYDADIESALLEAEVDIEIVLLVRRTITRAATVMLPDIEILCTARAANGIVYVQCRGLSLREATTMAEGDACFGW